MKRSKIFLGITTGVLAVVAFTAAKSAKYFTGFVNAYYTGSNHHCTLSAGASALYYTAGTSTDEAKLGSGQRLYEKNSGAACAVPLFTRKVTTD
jgi:hypothetical protein